MVIPYQTAKFKSASNSDFGSTTKLNSRQYFQLYGMILHVVGAHGKDHQCNLPLVPFPLPGYILHSSMCLDPVLLANNLRLHTLHTTYFVPSPLPVSLHGQA